MGAVRYRTQGRTSPTTKGRMMSEKPKAVVYISDKEVSADDVVMVAQRPDGSWNKLTLTELLDNFMIRVSNVESLLIEKYGKEVDWLK